MWDSLYACGQQMAAMGAKLGVWESWVFTDGGFGNAYFLVVASKSLGKPTW
jgi:hypothetical protein